MKNLIQIIFLTLLISYSFAVHAQQLAVQNLYGIGVTYNNSGSPEVAGTGLYAHLLSEANNTYAFTVVDALPASYRPFTVTTNMGAGVAQKVFSIGNYPVMVPTAVGISWDGSNTGWQWSGGVMVPIQVKKGNWYLMPNVRFLKSSIGTGYQPMAGFLIGWGK